MRSFRLKLTILAAGIGGVVIVLFGLAVWSSVVKTGQDRFDLEIKAAALYFQRVGPQATDSAGDEAAGGFYGEELKTIAFSVRDERRGELFRSPNWPEAIKSADLPRVPQEAWPQGRCERLHRRWAWDPWRMAGCAERRERAQPEGSGGGGGGVHRCGMRESTSDPLAAQPAAQVKAPPKCSTWALSSFSTLAAAGGSWRVGAFPDGPLTLFVAVDPERFQERELGLLRVFLLALLLALVASGIGGWWLASRALRPIMALTQAAEEVTADQLDRRISPDHTDRELARLIDVFNSMLERLERSYQQAVRFSADVSHELKTPLAVMRGEVEAVLHAVPEGSSAQQALASQLEEIQRLNGLVQKLLLLSRADAGTLRPRLSSFDLSESVSASCEEFEALHSELRFEQDIAPGVTVSADPSLLPQVSRNLLANATRYNEDGGFVRVSLSTEDGLASLRVTNSGPSVEPEDRERIFERFYRVDPARGRVAGAGLGLSLAREFARAHGGDVTFEGSADGNTFTLTLPARVSSLREAASVFQT